MLKYCFFLLSSFYFIASHCYRLNKKLCEGPVCLYLFESGGQSMSWDNSYMTCRRENLQMLKIESREIQTIVERLLQDLPSGSPGQVWIGGRRSTDDRWKYMNGTAFNKEVTTPDNELWPYCLYVKLCKTHDPEYISDNCDERFGSAGLLCQRDANNAGECNSAYTQLRNKCYLKTLYNGKDPNKIGWYNGQTYCTQSEIQGDIAYSYLDEKSSTNSIMNLVNPDADCIHLWLGVRKKIWLWETDQNNDVENPFVKYFHWYDDTAATPSGDCMYIDKDKGYKWLTKSCSANLNYCICMTDAPMTITITTTTGLTTNTTTTSTTTTIVNSAYLASIIISAILFVVVVTETVYCICLTQRLTSIIQDK